MADKIYLLRGNDTPMAVCLRYSEGGGEPAPYDLSEAERVRLALVGHGMHVFAKDTEVSGTDHNIVSGVIPGRSLLPGDYDLEVTFTLDGRDKRFAVDDMFEAVDFLAEDADNEAEGEGDGIYINVTVQPEEITVAGPTGPQGPKGDKGDTGEKGDKGDTGEKGDKGDTGATGPQGPKGDKGNPGSDASVTASNITAALGYTPADEDDIPDVSGFATTAALNQAVTGLGTAIEDKVDKVTGKGLSTNDYTTAEKDKLAGLPSGSELADDMAGKEDVSNKVTTVTSSGTDTQYPSAKAVFDAIEGKKDPTVISESGAEIVCRQTHGGVATGFSGAAVKGLKGRTLAFNQMIQVTDYPTITDGGITRTNNGNGSITLSGTATGLSYPSHDYYLINGHVYLYRMCPPDGASGKYLAELSGVGADHGGGIIGKFNETSGNRFCRLYIYENAVLNNVVIYPHIIDLTLMFGAGNEPSTVAEFEAMFPLPYYGYNEGELISVAAEGIETVGFNLWDEELLDGYHDTSDGSYHNYEGIYTTKNPIPVVAGKTYYIKNGVSEYVTFFDKNMAFIGSANYGYTFTAPAGCAYVHVNFGSYNHDICINISDASRNGTYEPHWSKVLPLGLDAFKVKDSQGNIITVNGLASAGDVRDEIRGGKYIKRVGRVDLGTLNWSYAGNDGVFFITGINTVVRDASIAANLISSKLEAVGYFDVVVPNKIGATIDSGNCYVRAAGDTNYNNDPTAFKTAMSGVYLYYELETPVEYDLASPMPSLYAVDDLGTEAKYPADTATSVTAPITADLQYGIKSRDIADYATTTALIQAVAGLSTAIEGKEDVLNKVTSISSSSTDTQYPGAKCVYDEVHPEVVSSQPSGGFLPNVFYNLGTLAGDTTFTLATPADANIVNHYYWTFDTPATAPTITWPTGITWLGGSAPTVNASKHYEISVLDGVGVSMEV